MFPRRSIQALLPQAYCLLALTAALSTSCRSPEEYSTQLGRQQQAIVGGALDESTEGVVGLALDLGLNRAAGHCSGTLIAPNLVLTARHCIATTSNGSGTVKCDSTQFEGSMEAGSLLVSADAIRPRNGNHESYIRGLQVRTLGSDSDVCGKDIALVILETPIFDIAPITPRVHDETSLGESFSTIGYGLTDPDDPYSDGTRQRANGSAVRCSGEDCVQLSDGAIRSSEWASVDAPICSGDSGGPAIDARGRVFGVASRGDSDCEVAVYGDVSSFGQFIVDTALEAAQLGEYDAPVWTDEVPDGSLPLPAIYTDADGGQPSSSASCSIGSRTASSSHSSSIASFMLLLLVCALRIKSHHQ